jgi:hypothetical protein
MSNEAIPPERAEPETVEVIFEIIELEDHAKHHHHKPAPHAKHYAFRVDKTRVVVDMPTITGREILAKVGKTPEKFKLYQHKHGHQPIQIGSDQDVNLREPGVERFTTMPRDTTEGREGPCSRQDFRMPEADETYLNNLGLQWEARLDGQNRLILIHGWKLPRGYTVVEATLGLLIPANYPDSQIDMVYFNPHLARLDGHAIASLTPFVIGGIAFQQWSRHRTSANPWTAGVDDLASHLALVDDWLRRELGERS